MARFNSAGGARKKRFSRKFEGNTSRREGVSRDRSGKVQQFTVKCSKCDKSCQVPFNPRGDKPVFCSDCFRKEEPKRSSDGLEEINAKLDKIMSALKISRE